MSDSVPDDGTSPMEVPPPEQTSPATEDKLLEDVIPFPTAGDIPDESTFAEQSPKQEGEYRGEVNLGEQPAPPERQPKIVEQPRPTPVEKPWQKQQPAQPQPRPIDSEPNFADMTPAPVSPGANQDENSVEHSLSALGAYLYLNRRALQLRRNEGAVEKNE